MEGFGTGKILEREAVLEIADFELAKLLAFLSAVFTVFPVVLFARFFLLIQFAWFGRAPPISFGMDLMSSVLRLLVW